MTAHVLNAALLNNRCDKGSLKHNYHTVYAQYLDPKQPQNVLEIGVYKGESTQAFVDYLPLSQIYTVDTFQRIPPQNVKALNNDRVHWLQGDSTSLALYNKINKEWGGVQMDVIIDDGAHWPKVNRTTLKRMFRLLRPGGSYFIEDVWPLNIMSINELQHSWLRQHSDKYLLEDYLNLLKACEETGGEIIHHDLRKSGAPDSYLIQIIKQ